MWSIDSYLLHNFPIPSTIPDRAERYDLKSQLWSFFSPFLFPPKKRGEKKRSMNSKNSDFKSYLSARFHPLPNTLHPKTKLNALNFSSISVNCTSIIPLHIYLESRILFLVNKEFMLQLIEHKIKICMRGLSTITKSCQLHNSSH